MNVYSSKSDTNRDRKKIYPNKNIIVGVWEDTVRSFSGSRIKPYLD